jgi:hypothetical protein
MSDSPFDPTNDTPAIELSLTDDQDTRSLISRRFKGNIR